MAGTETLQMSVNCLPKHGASLQSFQVAVPINQSAVANQNCRSLVGLYRNVNVMKQGEKHGRPHWRVTRRAMLSWLRLLLGAAALAASTTTAWSRDLRVAFINPTGPPEFWGLVSATMHAAAAELGIKVDERNTERSFDKAIAA